MPTSWHPTELIQSEDPPIKPYAIVVANVPINTNVYSIISKRAALIVLADGAGNHFYDQYLGHSKVDLAVDNVSKDKSQDVRLPDAVVGDLDSLKPDIYPILSSRGIAIHKDPDQYSTDIEKCLKWIWSHVESSSSSARVTTAGQCSALDIIILGNLSGRVDQAMSMLHQLYVFSREQPQRRGQVDHCNDDNHIYRGQSDGSWKDRSLSHYYFLSDQSLTFILEPGLNQIHFPPGSVFTTRSTKDISNPEPAFDDQENVNSIGGNTDGATTRTKTALFTENIGILPLAGPCKITTKGLEWNVESWPTKFGSGAMSTSNHIRNHEVDIEVSPFLERDCEDTESNKDFDEMMGPLFTVEMATRFCG